MTEPTEKETEKGLVAIVDRYTKALRDILSDSFDGTQAQCLSCGSVNEIASHALQAKIPPTAIEEVEEDKTLGIPDAHKASVEAQGQNHLGVRSDVAVKILAACDALTHYPHSKLAEAAQEAYHQLYSIADPSFTSLDPFAELERIASKITSVGRGNAAGAAPVSKESPTAPVVSDGPSKTEEWTEHHEKGELGLTSVVCGKEFLAASIPSSDAERLIHSHNASLSSLRGRCERLEREVANFKEKEAK